MTTKTLADDKLDAQLREADARLDALQAQAEASKATDQMVEIADLRGVRARAAQKFADLKQRLSANVEAARHAVEAELHDLESGIDRVRARYSAWDDARERAFKARLEEAEAKLRVWKAQVDQKRAELGIQGHDALATLEERIALARARFAERSRDRHDRKAEEAVEEEARHLDEAFDAAAKRYQQ